RPSQTHPQARSAAIARAEWRPRRIPPRRHRPKPPQARQADPSAVANRRELRRRDAYRRAPAIRAATLTSKPDFFNGIGHLRPYAAWSPTGWRARIGAVRGREKARGPAYRGGHSSDAASLTAPIDNCGWIVSITV